MTAPLPDIVVFGRPGCHLCDDAHVALAALLAERASEGRTVPAIVKRNIDEDQALHDRYAFTIPVVAVGGRELELATSPAKLRRLLAETLDGLTES